MPRKSTLLRMGVPMSVLLVLGCNAAQVVTGTTEVPQDVVVNGKPPETQVVSVEDSLPKPPRYSPYIVDHHTLNPNESPTPDPTPTPTPKPSPTATTGGTATGAASPSPGSSPVANPVTYSGTYKSALLAGTNTGTPAQGTGASAVLGYSPLTVGIGITLNGNDPVNVFFSDAAANQIRQIVLSSKAVAKLMGDDAFASTGNDNDLKAPGGAAYDASAKVEYYADTENNRIARLNPSDGSITWVGGAAKLADVQATPPFQDTDTANGKAASFMKPRGMAVDPNAHVLYIADSGFHAIRAMDNTQAASVVTTIAGTAGIKGLPGTGSEAAASAKLNTPSAVALSTDYKTLYIADTGNHVIRALDLTNKTISVLAGVAGTAGGTDGAAATATFKSPCALAVDVGHLYIGEQGTSRLRVLDLSTKTVTTALGQVTAGKGTGDKTAASFSAITGLGLVFGSNGVATHIYAYDAGDGATMGARLLDVTPQ